MFKNNMGKIDRMLRLILGVALLAAFFIFPDASWRWFTLIGIIPLVTAMVSSCPIYSIFGWNSRGADKS
jgi:Inner membrane protein YgaP-like, transmembrane domain